MADLPLLSLVTGQTPTAGNHLTTKTYVDVTSKGLAVVNARTANYILALSDKGGTVEMNSTSATAVTVPVNATVAFPIGTVIWVRKTNTGNVAVNGAVGVTIDWASASVITTRWTMAEIHKRGTDLWSGMLIGS